MGEGWDVDWEIGLIEAGRESVMGDMGETFRAMTALRMEVRAVYGQECQTCKQERPKGHAKILLPGQICGYGHRDRRPRITRAQYKEIEDRHGIKRL
jgi:hypothetical protein